MQASLSARAPCHRLVLPHHRYRKTQGNNVTVDGIQNYLSQLHAGMTVVDSFFDNRVGFWVDSLTPFLAALDADHQPYLASKERAQRALFVQLPGGLIVELLESPRQPLAQPASAAASAAPASAAAAPAVHHFRAQWRPERGEALSDAALRQARAPLHAVSSAVSSSASSAVSSAASSAKHCDLAVIGAGWGGAYFAWRLAVDTHTVDASNVCVFEANGRVGGRVYSVRGLPGMQDMSIDVGGYRFIESDKLSSQLVWDALKLPSACYDWACKNSTKPYGSHILKDVYGNNAGYATPVETMLGQVWSGHAAYPRPPVAADDHSMADHDCRTAGEPSCSIARWLAPSRTISHTRLPLSPIISHYLP